MKIAIGIATTGRREQLTLTLRELVRQTRAPDEVLVCPVTAADLDEAALAAMPLTSRVLSGGKGLTRQRNAILRACTAHDVVLFIDDDFYPDPHYLAELEAALTAHPDIVVMTNHPIADGATGPGIQAQAALDLLAQPRKPLPDRAAAIGATYGGYGCNMAIRLDAVRASGATFDENLPLYGWLEDIDFSRQLAPRGRICHNRRLIGVHLGSKSGRTSGLRLGYSQWANPIYLHHKGTMSLSYALRHVAKNTLKNLLRSLWAEPWVDRRGRLKGNLFALRDALTRHLHPTRAADL
jgi:GT2 family glycosyltransferase